METETFHGIEFSKKITQSKDLMQTKNVIYLCLALKMYNSSKDQLISDTMKKLACAEIDIKEACHLLGIDNIKKAIQLMKEDNEKKATSDLDADDIADLAYIDDDIDGLSAYIRYSVESSQ